MNQLLTPQEQDALSAYLDNALNPRERQRLEVQLQTRPEMRAALNELRQTQYLLRQTPVLQVPRNFTLSPEMAGLRTRPPRVYPIFQWAFSLASLFFILIFAGELFTGLSIAGSSVALAPVAETFILEEAPIEVMEAPPVGSEDGARNAEELQGEQTATGYAELPPMSEGTPTPDMIFSIAESPTPTPEPTFKSAPETEVVEEPVLPAQDPLAQSVPTGPESAMDTAMSEPTAPAPAPHFWASPWRVPQIILGAVVLISGLGLLFFRRKTML
jgi:hypothetical protein